MTVAASGKVAMEVTWQEQAAMSAAGPEQLCKWQGQSKQHRLRLSRNKQYSQRREQGMQQRWRRDRSKQHCQR